MHSCLPAAAAGRSAGRHRAASVVRGRLGGDRACAAFSQIAQCTGRDGAPRAASVKGKGRYWLLVIGYWLLVIGYWLLVVGCWLAWRFTVGRFTVYAIKRSFQFSVRRNEQSDVMVGCVYEYARRSLWWSERNR